MKIDRRPEQSLVVLSWVIINTRRKCSLVNKYIKVLHPIIVCGDVSRGDGVSWSQSWRVLLPPSAVLHEKGGRGINK